MSATPNFPGAMFSCSELGAAFRAERKALGQTQAGIAKRVGCRRQTIADIEAGKNVAMYTLMAALSALGKGLRIVDFRIDYDHLAEMFPDD